MFCFKQIVGSALLLGTAAFAQPGPPPPPPPGGPAIFTAMGGGGSYLGVGVADVNSDRAKALNLSEVRGVELTSVEEEAPAAKAGLKTGDVILEFNGQRVEGMDQLMRMVRETPPGREVRLGYSRNGQTQTATLTTAARKRMAFARQEVRDEVRRAMENAVAGVMDMPRPNMSWRSGMLGIEGEALQGSLAEFFGVKEGVLVRNVGKGTPAEKAGLKAGDVITKIDQTPVSSPRAITAAIREQRERTAFPLTVVREKRETAVTVTIEPSAERPGQRGQPVKY